MARPKGTGFASHTKTLPESGFPSEAIASPYVGGLGGSTPLLVHFLGVSEKRT